jgi:hypothetical protein
MVSVCTICSQFTVCQIRMIPRVNVTGRVDRDYDAVAFCTKYERIVLFTWTSDWKFEIFFFFSCRQTPAVKWLAIWSSSVRNFLSTVFSFIDIRSFTIQLFFHVSVYKRWYLRVEICNIFILFVVMLRLLHISNRLLEFVASYVRKAAVCFSLCMLGKLLSIVRKTGVSDNVLRGLTSTEFDPAYRFVIMRC